MRPDLDHDCLHWRLLGPDHRLDLGFVVRGVGRVFGDTLLDHVGMWHPVTMFRSSRLETLKLLHELLKFRRYLRSTFGCDFQYVRR